MKTFEQMQQEYAELIVRFGVNLQSGQNLIINAPLESHHFVQLLTKEAYKAWAQQIFYRRRSEELDLIKYQMAPEEVLDLHPQWLEDGYTAELKSNCAQIALYMTDPNLFNDIDPQKISRASATRAKSKQAYRKLISENAVNRTIAAIPTAGWANAIYKTEESTKNIHKLRMQIFQLTRIDQDNPLAAWHQHLDQLNSYATYLNTQNFEKLHYLSSKTNLWVQLPEWHHWIAAGEKTQNWIPFCANLPTEEVFSMPHKYGVDGILQSTFPLEYAGKIIENFGFKFENGAVIDFWAEKGYEVLKNLLATDQNAKRLGEVAIVPINSPIYQSGIIFSNTLFDENASCHFALWNAYPTTIKEGSTLTPEQKDQLGVNESIIHVDFMVGDEELCITGVRADGSQETFFQNGKRKIPTKK